MSEHIELGALRYRRNYADEILRLSAMLTPFASLHKHEQDLRDIVSSMDSPFRIAVYGYMKRGKSSLINALIGQKLTVTGTEETTATVNHITHAPGTACSEFTAYWKNSPPQRFPLPNLSEWSGKDDAVEEKVRNLNYLEFYSDSPLVRQMNIIDTPGIGSGADFHEAVARQFLSGGNTDALIYVFGSVVRQEDVQALNRFRELSLQGYDAYNCMGILHLWDDMYWNSAREHASADECLQMISNRAGELKARHGSLLRNVLPVSAPLGLLATVAPPDFWESVLELLGTYDSHDLMLQSLDANERIWKRKGAAIYTLWERCSPFELPLSSFRMMLHYLYDKAPATPAEARSLTRHLSGLPQLHLALDADFFKRRTVIALRQIRSRVQEVLRKSTEAMSDMVHDYEREVQYFEDVYKCLTDARLKNETQYLSKRAQAHIEQLSTSLHEFDSLRIRIAEKVQRMDDALYLAREWQDRERWLTEQQLMVLDSCVELILRESELTAQQAGEYYSKLNGIAGQLTFAPSLVARKCGQKVSSVAAHFLEKC